MKIDRKICLCLVASGCFVNASEYGGWQPQSSGDDAFVQGCELAGGMVGAVLGSAGGAAVGTVIDPAGGELVGVAAGGFLGGVSGVSVGKQLGRDLEKAPQAIANAAEAVADCASNAVDSVEQYFDGD